MLSLSTFDFVRLTTGPYDCMLFNVLFENAAYIAYIEMLPLPVNGLRIETFVFQHGGTFIMHSVCIGWLLHVL